jgi:ribonuclease HII
MNSAPLTIEKELWGLGHTYVAGLDEVGRGCFAGPVVCGCVIFAPNIEVPSTIRIDDSKKLTPLQRKKANQWIKLNSLAWGLGHTSAKTINKIGITKATELSFLKALKNTSKRLKFVERKIDYLLVDAFPIKSIKIPQKAIIRGDSQSFSIAAASTLAKVYRDTFMEKISKKHLFTYYSWNKNKGYGSLEHRKAILLKGITNQHRVQYVKTFLRKSVINFDFASFQAQFDA